MTIHSAKNTILLNFSSDRDINHYLWEDMISMEREVIDSFFYLTKERMFNDIIEKYQNITIEEFLKHF